MNKLKNIFAILIVLLFAISCEKEIDNLDKLGGVSTPSDISATFNITQDNSGLVTIIPGGTAVTSFMVKFGDVSGEKASEYGLDEKITHTYAEGVYTVEVIGVGISGLTANYTAELNVTFKAPENLVVSISADDVNPRLINVSATADFVTVMDIYFGDTIDEVPVTVLPGEVASHLYTEPGDFVITVEAKSGGEATTIQQDTITIEAASDPVNLPIDFESFMINYAFADFGGNTATVIDNPDPNGINTSIRVAQSIKSDGAETWAGSLLTLENPIDFSSNKLFKMKVWSPKTGAIVKLKVENIDNGDINYEVDASTTTSNEWELLEYDFSGIDINNDYQKVVVFFDFGNVGDGSIYYFDDIELSSTGPGPGIAGIWKMKPEAGSLGVGENQGDISWWSIDEAGIIERACYFDDSFVFGDDGSFSNVLGSETWIEEWQGMNPPGCGAPVAPHDGSAAATYVYDEAAGTVTLNGTGAYLGIAKVYNGGELSDPGDAPESITYMVEFSDNGLEMTIDISIGSGWWRYIMVKEGGSSGSPLEGNWQMALEAGSLGVGETQGDISWWSIDEAGLVDRACYFDDSYVFGSDGSFSNVPGSETWIEEWQGMNPPGCGTPVAPHDGSATAAFSYNETDGTLTLNGTGAYLGLAKAYNGGELSDPANAPESITYLVELSENNTVMILDIDVSNAWWRFKLVKN